jgi:hypothetical protein
MKNTWQNLNNSGTSTGFLAFPLRKEFSESSGTAGPSTFGLNAGGKNSLWGVWNWASNLLRPKDPQGSRPVLRRYAGLPGGGDSPHLLPQVREGETGKARLAVRFSLLHRAICLLHWPSLPGFDSSGRGPRVPFALEDGQGPGEAPSFFELPENLSIKKECCYTYLIRR